MLSGPSARWCGRCSVLRSVSLGILKCVLCATPVVSLLGQFSCTSFVFYRLCSPSHTIWTSVWNTFILVLLCTLIQKQYPSGLLHFVREEVLLVTVLFFWGCSHGVWWATHASPGLWGHLLSAQTATWWRLWRVFAMDSTTFLPALSFRSVISDHVNPTGFPFQESFLVFEDNLLNSLLPGSSQQRGCSGRLQARQQCYNKMEGTVSSSGVKSYFILIECTVGEALECPESDLYFNISREFMPPPPVVCCK